MYAKKTTFRFYPDAIEDGTSIIRDIMIPSASGQPGFRGAFLLRDESHPDQHLVVSLWETMEDLLASQPPDETLPLLEPLQELIAEESQAICEVLLHVNK